MRVKFPLVVTFFFATRLACLIALLIVGLAGAAPGAGAQPPNCIHVLYCLYDWEASASDPAGIHKYSSDLIDLLLPDQWTFGPPLGKGYAAGLAGQLALAEQMARTGRGKLVSEAAVAKAFNDLMQETGAPASMRVNEASVHGFREHAAAIKAFPALFTADRNGANCNPGEAVFILSLLIEDSGLLYEKNLDVAEEMMQPYNGPGTGGGGTIQVGGGRDPRSLLLSYTSNHGRGATIALFDQAASTLGF